MTPRTTAAALLVLASSSAWAGTYEVQPLKDGDSFVGCMAVNTADGVVLLGTEKNFALLVSSPDFKVVKGDAVDGTWSIDNSKSRPLSARANGTGTVSIDLELTKEDFALVSGGDELEVKLGKTTHTFSLDGSQAGLAMLTACMNKNGK